MEAEVPATRIRARDNTDAINLEQKYDVIIFEKEILTTVTAIRKNANDWVLGVHIQDFLEPYHLIVGLDIKLHNNCIALLVLFVNRRCLIFEFTLTTVDSVPKTLRQFLSNLRNTFVGIDMESKIALLQRDYGLAVGARRYDVGALMAARYKDRPPGLRNAGLSELRMVLGWRDVERPVVADDWDVAELSNAQVHRACIDAYITWRINSETISSFQFQKTSFN